VTANDTAKVVVRGTDTLVETYLTFKQAENSADERNERAEQMGIQARYDAKGLYDAEEAA
jgi:hypothetical protein